MSKIYHIIIIAVLLLLFLSCSPTQQFGKIFTKAKADELFGKVIFSTEIPQEIVVDVFNKTEKNIMFGIVKQNAIVLDNNRKLLYPVKAEFKDTDVFTVYSVSVLKELLSKGKSPNINVEQRKEVLSVSYNDYTLETGNWCPPFCSQESK